MFDQSDLTSIFVGTDGTGGNTAAGGVAGRILNKGTQGGFASAAADNERPVLDRRPVSGCRNLLTQTEEPDGADWGASDASVSGNTVTATGAAGYVNQIVTVSPNTVHTASVAFNPPDQKVLLQFNGTGSATVRYKVEVTSAGDASVTLAGGASTPDDFGIDTSSIPWRVFVTGNTGASNTTGIVYFYPDIDGTTGSAELVNAQLELGSTATPYQRVTNDNDITETGIRSVYSLDYDGVDDGMSFDFEGGAGPADCSVFFAVKTTDAKFCLLSDTSTNYAIIGQDGSALNGVQNVGTPELYVDSVQVVTAAGRDDIYTAISTGSFVFVELRNADFSGWSQVDIAKISNVATFELNGNLIGPIIVPTSKLTNSLRRSIETYLKRKAGIL
jgi:hypothetical protein